MNVQACQKGEEKLNILNMVNIVYIYIYGTVKMRNEIECTVRTSGKEINDSHVLHSRPMSKCAGT